MNPSQKQTKSSLLRFAILIGILATFLSGCDEFVLWDIISDSQNIADGSALVIAPISAEVAAGSALTFTATGGTPPYSFLVVSGDGTMNPSSGIYTAPSGASVDVIRVFDDAGDTNDAQVVIFE